MVAVGLFAGGATGWGLWLGLLRRWPLGVALAGHDLGLYLAVGALALAGAAAARRHETPIVVGASAAAGGLLAAIAMGGKVIFMLPCIFHY